MTEEELKKKADKYHLDNVTSEEVFYHSGTSEKVRKAFIDGAKSRDSEIEQERNYAFEYLKPLIDGQKKEIEELKATISKMEITTEKNSEVENLEKENAELKKDLQTAIDVNKKWLQRDTKLEEQIEKMKCCENCKHYDDCCSTEWKCENNDKWELE